MYAALIELERGGYFNVEHIHGGQRADLPAELRTIANVSILERMQGFFDSEGV